MEFRKKTLRKRDGEGKRGGSTKAGRYGTTWTERAFPCEETLGRGN